MPRRRKSRNRPGRFARRLLLETLEVRQLLAVDGLGLAGDSLTDDDTVALALAEPTTGLLLHQAGASDSYTLFSPNTTTSTYLIDRDGNTINQWESNYVPGLLAYLQQDGSLIRASSPNGQGGNGTITAAGSGGLIEQFDWEGNKVWEFGYGDQAGDQVLQHHDFEILPNGNLLLIAWELKSEAAATQAGRDPSRPGAGYLYPDHIVEVQPDFENGGGEIVWQWHVWDHLVQEHDATKDNWYGPTGVEDHPELIDINYVSTFDDGGGQAEDWTHANGIDYNAERDEILLSVREFSEFWVIDHNTTTAEAAGPAGDLLYRWGNPQAYDRGDADDRVLFYQHDAKWIENGLPGEGNITVFNNGFGRAGADFSAVEEIAPPLDTGGDYQLSAGQAYGPASTVWTYQAPVENFSAIISGTERLGNGNTLITYGVSGKFVEVTPAGDEVWKYVNPHTGAGDLGPTDPIPNAGIPGDGLNTLLTNFTFRAIDSELDSVWSVDVSSTTIREDTALPESVIYTLSGPVLENQQSAVQIDVQGNGGDLQDWLQAVASAVNQYNGPGGLAFDLGTRTLTYVGGAGGTRMDDLFVPIQPVDDDQSEYTESVEFVLSNPSSATGALVKVDPDRSLGAINILDDDQTALDRYVAKPDASYEYSLVNTIPSAGVTTYIIELTSQTWRTAQEVDKPIWKHWLQIIVPDNVVSDTALLIISGGSNTQSEPTQPNIDALNFALATNQVAVHLPTVPSEPLLFSDESFPRSEDEIIAYSYDKFLDGGDEEWPLLLPMVKSAVRAMDTAQDFLAANSEQNVAIEDFFVTGASKRGWTTWLTAAADPRVSGIVPAVIDVLNTEQSIMNHRENYAGVTQGIIGGYAESIHDYTELGIFDRFDTTRGRELAAIVDPYSYLDRLTMPKYLLNSAGDQFFTPDSSQFYIDDLLGPTYLRYFPNTGHGLDSNAPVAAATFVALVDAGVPLPEFDWTVEGVGQNVIRVDTVDAPFQVNLWQATNPNSLDFRIDYFGPGWSSTRIFDQGGGEYVGSVPLPATGGTAFFVELRYFVAGQVMTFTTEARIAKPFVDFLDFGDAPVSYGTLLDDDGARHVVDLSGLPRLGSRIDGEDDGQPVNQDDALFDDEDGLQIGTLIDGTKSYTVFTQPGVDPNQVLPDQVLGFLNPDDPTGADVSVWVTGTGRLDGWIDFDQSGVFDADEQVLDSVAVSGDPINGTFVTLNIQTPTDAIGGMTWMRLRISDSGGLSPYGIAIGGEVEDYPVEVLRFTQVPPDANEPPVFDINLPLDTGSGLPTLDILERDDSVGTMIDDFVINIAPGQPTSLDELHTQTVTFTVTEIDVPPGLMTALPQLTADGQLTVFPAPDAVGSASYAVTLIDDHPTNPQSTTKNFVVRLQPVNDPPALNLLVVPSSDSNPANSEDAYAVASDGTITYTLREDNTQSAGVTEPFFIPLVAGTTDPYNRIGLLDVFTVGPANESDGTPGGAQSLSLISSTFAGGQRIAEFTVEQLTDNNVIDANPQISDSNIVWWSGANGASSGREIMFFDGTDTIRVTDNDFIDMDPQVSGENVTWWGQTGASANDREIFFWDGTTITQLTDDSIRDELPQISGSTVVWESGAGLDKEIYKWDGTSPQNVSSSVAAADSSPQIDGNNIVYKSGSSPNIAIWRNDGVTNAPVSSVGLNKSNPQLDGDRVVWEQFEVGSDTEIYYFNGSQALPLTDNDFNDFQPQISGDKIVWRGGTFPNIEIYVYDGFTIQQITDNSFTDLNPQIDGNIVVWQGNDGHDNEIFAWDGIGITQLTDNEFNDELPRISGNEVVWQGWAKSSGDGIEIFHATLTLAPTTTQRGGTLTPVAGGWNYVPPLDFNFELGGVDSFTYEVRDDGNTYVLSDNALIPASKSRTNRVEIVLNPVNDPPSFTLSSDRVVVQEDSGQISLPNFASDLAGGPILSAFDENDSQSLQALMFTLVPLDFDTADLGDVFSSPPAIDSQSGLLSFQTVKDVFGSFQFEVRLIDGEANDPSRGDINQSASQTLTIDIYPVNDPPVLDPSAPTLEYALPEDGSVEILLRSDGGVPGLLDVFVAGPSTPQGDETANITPGGNQSVTLGAPIPTTTSQGGTLQLLTGDGPPRLLYTPRADFSGIDTFVYSVVDDGVTVGLDGVPVNNPRIASTRVQLNVAPINDPPVFGVTTSVLQSQEDAGLVSVRDWATNVQPGPPTAADELSGPTSQIPRFQFTQIDGDPALIVPASISAAIDPVTHLATLYYRSASDANGTATFEVVLLDDGPNDPGNGDQNASAPRTLTIEITPINDLPTFNFVSDDPISVAEDSGPFIGTLVENISPGADNEGAQTVLFEVQPLESQFASLFSKLPTIDAEGILRFTTAPNKNTDNADGPVYVQFLARDSLGAESGKFTFPIEIGEVNDPPIAKGDSFATDEDTAITIPVGELLANDVDPDLLTNANELLRIQLASESRTSSGALLLYDLLSGQISYDPTTAPSIQGLPPDQFRTDSFTYSLIDAAGLVSNSVIVSLKIAGRNDAPTTVFDSPQLELQGSTTIRVLDNDSDVDGEIVPSTVQINAVPALGSASVTSAGVIIYTPYGEFTSEDSFSYTVADNLGLRSAPATVTISANPSPLARNDTDGTFIDEPVLIDVADNDFDANGLDLTSVVVGSRPRHGQAIAQLDGTVLYVPAAGFIGGDSFTYQISDTLGRASNIATVTVRVVASRLHNPVLSADVNADGHVTAIDALLIINHLHNHGNVSEIPVVDSDRGPNYYDVSGDQSITAVDALRVVNAIRQLNIRGAEAEPIRPQAVALKTPATSPAAIIEPVFLDLTAPAKIVSSSLPDGVSQQQQDNLAEQREPDDDQDPVTAAIDAAITELW